MSLQLEIVSGPLTGKKVVVEDGQTVRIGRTSKSDFVTDDRFMSGKHFAVLSDGPLWIVHDLKSRNGIKLNGNQVTTAELHEGDRIHAGSTDFIVHLEIVTAPDSERPNKDLLVTLPPAVPPSQPLDKQFTEGGPPSPRTLEKVTGPQPKLRTSTQIKQAAESAPPPSIPADAEPAEIKSSPEPLPKKKSPPMEPTPSPPLAMQSYEAVTPSGRLLHLLQHQPEPLFALVDATREKEVLTMLQTSVGEEYASLYRDPQNASIAPYLIRFSGKSELLRQMAQRGWGHSWGVYLTCSLQLAELREYYRRELMVSLPDGTELFSRFYDPRFFRVFLDSCSKAEGEKFFGPISSYLMEAEKPEIVLQFRRSSAGIEKQGHLLTDLS